MPVSDTIAHGRQPLNYQPISIAGGVDQTLTVDQAIVHHIELQGAITANINVNFPTVAGDKGSWWVIFNNTTGAFTVTVKPASGTGVAIGALKRALILFDGTNFGALVNDVVALGAAARGANTDITSLAGLTGGITGLGGINFDSIRGNNVALAFNRLVKALPSDANYTLTAAEMASPWIEITGAITAQRNIVLPLTAGAIWHVFNNTTGGFGLQFIGATGTGTVVAATKRAVIGADSTNIIRWSPDNP